MSAFFAAALFLACALPDPAHDVETRLVGQRARTVQRCLGTAEYFERLQDGSEVWGYSAPLRERGTPSASERALLDLPDTPAGRVQSRGSRGLDRTLSVTPGVQPGSCVYFFEMKEEEVRSVRVRGRTKTNLNADGECALLVNRCLAP